MSPTSGKRPRTGPAVRLLILLLMLAALACAKRVAPAGPDWLTDPLVTGTTPVSTSIAVDLYVDATDSMAGFVSDQRSNYLVLLGQLEAAIQQGWSDANTSFHKFGTTIVPMERDEYVIGTRDRSFYLDPRTRQHTNIDLVIDSAANDRVTIVVTDLFQNRSDVNRLVQAVKEKCFKRGIDVAIVALRSQFNGTVHDTRSGSFVYASTADPATYRPVYLLLFGDVANLQQLVERIAQLRQLGTQNHLLISDHVIARYAPMVKKLRGNRAVNPRPSEASGVFTFDLKKDFDGAPFDMNVKLEQKPGAPVLRSGAVELTGADGNAVDEFTLREVSRTGDSIHGLLELRTRKPPGTHKYDLVLRAGASGALATPQWVAEYSSQDPRPDSEANRTLNLEAFVGGLIDAKNTIAPPALARMTLVIHRK